MPVNIVSFIERVSREGLPIAIPDELRVEERRVVLTQLLKEYSLNAEALLDECLRQIEVGGGRPDVVLGQLEGFSERQRLLRDMLEIRGKEVNSSELDEAERLRLAQEKLLKKKQLEKRS